MIFFRFFGLLQVHFCFSCFFCCNGHMLGLIAQMYQEYFQFQFPILKLISKYIYLFSMYFALLGRTLCRAFYSCKVMQGEGSLRFKVIFVLTKGRVY